MAEITDRKDTQTISVLTAGTPDLRRPHPTGKVTTKSMVCVHKSGLDHPVCEGDQINKLYKGMLCQLVSC